jgi:hypothetical protein
MLVHFAIQKNVSWHTMTFGIGAFLLRLGAGTIGSARIVIAFILTQGQPKLR